MTAKLCPLCDAALTDISIFSNNEKRIVAGELVGFSAGRPSMGAVCANGCFINVQAVKTTDKLWSKS